MVTQRSLEDWLACIQHKLNKQCLFAHERFAAFKIWVVKFSLSFPSNTELSYSQEPSVCQFYKFYRRICSSVNSVKNNKLETMRNSDIYESVNINKFTYTYDYTGALGTGY